MKKYWVILVLVIAAWVELPAQGGKTSLVQSGPMVGYAEMREVMLWVQTSAAAEVSFEYWQREGQPSTRYRTSAVKTEKSHAFTAHCVADQVLPGRKYEAKLLINGKPAATAYPIYFQSLPLWQYRTDPPAFTFATGSCNFVNDSTYDRPGKPYGNDQGIFRKISDLKPDFMLWLGDNTYLREADWNTQTGIQYRYTHSRKPAELQQLLAQSHHYAIWDDHDFGPNDADHSFIHKDLTLQAFQDFWANPSYGLPESAGITTQFQWGDCDFFLLDNRYHRAGWAQSQGNRTMLGEAQVRWLLDGLKYSRANFKFVAMGGQFLSTAAVYENYINLFPQEREHILSIIQQEGIKNVIFLTGDRHHTALSSLTLTNGVTLYDLTVSPLTSGAYPGDGPANKNLVADTEVAEQNFATLSVSGPYKKRSLQIKVFDAKGTEKWTKTIEAQ